MNTKPKLILKACLWEFISFWLGLLVMYLVTKRFDLSFGISIVLLPIKAILLAIYDFIFDNVFKVKRG